MEHVRYDRMTWQQRREVRLGYVRSQKGLCYHCKGDLEKPSRSPVHASKIDWTKFPPNFRQNPVHLHHNHMSGMTIGAVHAHCNAVLWQYYGE